MKLFFKTLLRSIKYLIVFLLTYFVGNYFVVIPILNDLSINNNDLRSVFVVGIPVVVEFVFATIIRCKDEDLAYEYEKSLSESPFNIWTDIIATIKSQRYISSVLVFLLYVCILVLIGGRIIFSVSIADGIFTIAIPIFLFLLLNLLSLEVVHIKTHVNIKKSKNYDRDNYR